MIRTLSLRVGIRLIAAVALVACSGTDDDPDTSPVDGTVGGRRASGSPTGSSSGSKQATSGTGSLGGAPSTTSLSGGASFAGFRAVGGGVATGGSLATVTGVGTSTVSGAGEAGRVASGGSRTNSGSRSSAGVATGAGGTNRASGGTNAAGGTPTGGRAVVGGTGAAGFPSGGSKTSGGTVGRGGSAGSGGSTTGGRGTSTAGTSTTPPIAGAGTAGSGTSPTGTDGCSETLAQGITINEIAVFQTGKISIMKAGSAVSAVTEHGAAVIQGRDTLFRIYMTADSGFQSRQLSARLTLNGATAPYYAKQTISGSSAELSTSNAFQISVPASEITSNLNYSVKIVECGTGSGTSHSPQFPASGSAPIATVATGVIKVTLVPISTKNVAPDLTTVATRLAAQIEAQYPTTKAQITVSTTAITTCGIAPSTATDPTTWDSCLTSVRDRRSADKPASDVYYMGIVVPATSYAQYCGNACIAGVGYVATRPSTSVGRALVAVGYVPEGLNSITHELGHNHGLEHSPGCGADSADASFPYLVSGVAHIGWVGWDKQKPTKFMDPAVYTDLMGYCDPVWPSDYIYGKFATRIAALNGASAILKGDRVVSTWRVLDVINGNPRWGASIAETMVALGEPVGATVLDAQGNALAEITVYRTQSSSRVSDMYLVPEPSVGWERLQLGTIETGF